MLRSLTGGRRKFSFDLALHRSREKKQDAAKRDTKTASRTAEDNTPRVATWAAPRGGVAEKSHAQLRSQSFVGPEPEDRTQEMRQSWRDLREARQQAGDEHPTRARSDKPAFRPKPESLERGRKSARGDDAPRIRELSRDGSRERTGKPRTSGRAGEVKESVASAKFAATKAEPEPNQSRDLTRTLFGESRDSWYAAVLGSRSPEPPQRQSRSRPVQLQDPPSWQQLKAKALEADYASMVDFLDNHDESNNKLALTAADPRGRRPAKNAIATRAASATRATAGEAGSSSGAAKDDASFERWFTSRFPENNIASAPAAHKALWAEHDRQRRALRRAPAPRVVSTDTYLDRLRTRAAPHPAGDYKSGSVSTKGRVLRDGGSTTVHTVTWRVETWSALPSGFRQGARYRPPGGAPWSLDLYKGGIKREKPGMIALYVHYDAPDRASFATVTALELSLLNQATGVHLARKHEGTRIFGPKADQRRRISTSAGTASLAHLVLTQVHALGFCIDDTLVLRAEIEVAPPLHQPTRPTAFDAP